MDNNKDKFVLISKTVLSDLTLNEGSIPKSDYAVHHNGTLYQFKFVREKEELRKIDVNAGIFSIIEENNTLKLTPTSFTKDSILEEFVNTKRIEAVVDSFFNNLHIYKEEGFDVPRRAALLFGSAGSGKSTSITKVAEKYATNNDTLILIWHTAKYDADVVKSFIKCFDYGDRVKNLILIMEDVGGIENEGVAIRSDSSLLSLLDNVEKTFTIPTFILATTNYPEALAENLTNRPGRFDDKIKISSINADGREALIKFFAKDRATEAVVNYIKSKECDGILPSHIREANIRSRIRAEDLLETLKSIVNEIKQYNKGFADNTRGIGFHDPR